MLSPTAAAPLAVLVLAWDETTPAVRALVEAHAEAAPAFDSVVVVVPAGSPEATEPTQEEFLPLAAGPELLAASTPTTAEATTETPAEEPTPAAPTTPLLLSESAPILADELSVATTLPATLVPDAEQLTLVPASTWAEVRIIRLSSFSLPALADLTSQALPAPAWLLTAISPATPYVGRSEESALVEVPVVTPVVETASLEEVETAPFAEATTAPPTPVSAVEPLAAEPASSSALPSPVAITLAAGENDNLDAEADTAPMLVADEDAAATLLPAPAPPFVPEQASWPEALAALREPVAVPEATPKLLPPAAPAANEPAPSPAYPALQLKVSSFAAPDLNFQVIQYARFAVPVALAEPDFAAIYAPAWPTWLAAQELRQRTGRPLVLHVASLAAADEPIETATGWQAELQRQALHRADLVLTETPALAERLRRELNIPASLVSSVPAADTAAIAYALHHAQPRPNGSLS